MDKEIKYLLEEIKDNTYDYVGTNGCLYQDLSREELNLLLNYINNLEQQCKKQREVIDKANKLLKEKVKVIPFDENGEGGGLELTDYDIQDLLDILKENGE